MKSTESPTTEIIEKAKLHDGRFLVSHHDWISKEGDYIMCNELVNQGLANWDRASSMSPCIKLTEAAYHV